jgi:hypothetical protein
MLAASFLGLIFNREDELEEEGKRGEEEGIVVEMGWDGMDWIGFRYT